MTHSRTDSPASTPTQSRSQSPNFHVESKEEQESSLSRSSSLQTVHTENHLPQYMMDPSLLQCSSCNRPYELEGKTDQPAEDRRPILLKCMHRICGACLLLHQQNLHVCPKPHCGKKLSPIFDDRLSEYLARLLRHAAEERKKHEHQHEQDKQTSHVAQRNFTIKRSPGMNFTPPHSSGNSPVDSYNDGEVKTPLVDEEEDEDATFCTVHPTMHATFWCSCKTPVCEACRIDGGHNGVHHGRGHKILPISGILPNLYRERNQRLVETETARAYAIAIREELLKEKKGLGISLTNALANLESLEDLIHREVRAFFSLRKELANSMYKDEVRNLDCRVMVLDANIETLETYHQEVDAQTDRQLLEGHDLLFPLVNARTMQHDMESSHRLRRHAVGYDVACNSQVRAIEHTLSTGIVLRRTKYVPIQRAWHECSGKVKDPVLQQEELPKGRPGDWQFMKSNQK